MAGRRRGLPAVAGPQRGISELRAPPNEESDRSGDLLAPARASSHRMYTAILQLRSTSGNAQLFTFESEEIICRRIFAQGFV